MGLGVKQMGAVKVVHIQMVVLKLFIFGTVKVDIISDIIYQVSHSFE